MGFFGKKKVEKGPVAVSDQVRAEMGLPLDSDAPFVKAQLHHDDRFLRLASHAANWRKFAFISAVTSVCAVAGVVYMASLPRVVPVFIAVDKLGRTAPLVAGVAEGARVDPRKLIYREMVNFIENTRSVTSDYAANNKALAEGFSRLVGAAHTYVKTDLMSHKPNEVAEKKTIVVEVKLAMPITVGGQRNSWQVEWTETSYSLKGEQMGAPEMWKANIQYELHPGNTEDEVNLNPLGFTIPTLSWAKQV